MTDNDHSIFRTKWFWILAACPLVIIMYGWATTKTVEPSKEEKTPLQKQMDALEIVAVSLIVDQLKSPATAKIVPGSVRSYNNGTTWVVEGKIDAQNVYGAYLRQSWIVGLNPYEPCDNYLSTSCWEVSIQPALSGVPGL